jgi:hypothetical protein
MRCWYTRWQMSSALDRGDLGSRISRGHAAGCASCQAFGRALEALDGELTRGARAAAAPIIPGRPRRRLLPIAAPLAVAATAIVVAISGVKPVDRVDRVAGAPSVHAPGTLVRVRDVADQVTRVLATTPLDTELDDLIADGKRGLDAVLAIGGLR